MGEALHIPEADALWLAPHLPTESAIQSAKIQNRPYVTLTFATSLDSSLSLAPGVRTRLSGPESKAMTHHLRRHHAAILVGVGTVIADDPGLNCRMDGADLDAQPRPIVLDPRGRWDFTENSKVFEVTRAGNGLAPFILVGTASVDSAKRAILEAHGGKYITLETRQETTSRFDWPSVLSALHVEGLHSVMIEGEARSSTLSLTPTISDSSTPPSSQSRLPGLDVAASLCLRIGFMARMVCRCPPLALPVQRGVNSAKTLFFAGN